MTYFKKPDHAYHRIIFEFTDNEMKAVGFERMSIIPSEQEILKFLHRIINKNADKNNELFEMSVKKDLWKTKALRLIGFLDNKEKKIEHLKRILEKAIKLEKYLIY